MRSWGLAVLLLVAAAAAHTAHAADACPALRSQQAAGDPATRIAAVACNEHMIWYRPFIDRNGRIASSAVMEADASLLGDGVTPAWRRVAGYWRESGLLSHMSGIPGAGECGHASMDRFPSPACRTFVLDNAWSAAFVSWVLAKAAIPGFRSSATHADYVRSALLQPEESAFAFTDPTTARPAPGDMLCYVRVPGQSFGHAGLRTVLASSGGGLPMHCDIVVAANPAGGQAYLVGGNVQQGVTMRLLPLNRSGAFWGLPQRQGADLPCTPDNEAACNFNRQDWSVLLKLKPAAELARLPRLSQWWPLAAPRVPAQQACCVNCVVGSGVPRCPKAGTPVP